MAEKPERLKRQEATERPSATCHLPKMERRDHFVPVSRPVFICRFFIQPTRLLGQNLDLIARDRAPSPIRKEHHQESCCTNTQKHSSQETKHQMLETATQTKTKSVEMDIKESKIPHFQPEQSLFRSVIRFLIILLIILGVVYIIRIGSQMCYRDVEGIARFLIQKLRFTRRFNPPI